jgi:hypothetical protein
MVLGCQPGISSTKNVLYLAHHAINSCMRTIKTIPGPKEKKKPLPVIHLQTKSENKFCISLPHTFNVSQKTICKQILCQHVRLFRRCKLSPKSGTPQGIFTLYRVFSISLCLTLTLTSESVYGSQFFHCKLPQVLMSY